MHPKHGDIGAAVGQPLATGGTLATMKIRLHAASIPLAHLGDTRADFQDFDTEFMPQNAGITKERLPAMKGMVIGAAEADAMHPDKSFTLAWRERLRGIMGG
jgi:hypothetical protein